jgi:hypothetical protein
VIFDMDAELPADVVEDIDTHIAKHNGVAAALGCDRICGFEAEDEEDEEAAMTSYFNTQCRAGAYASVIGWAKTVEVYPETMVVGIVDTDGKDAPLPAIRVVCDVFAVNNSVRQTVLMHLGIDDAVELIQNLTHVLVGAAHNAGQMHQPLYLGQLAHDHEHHEPEEGT